MRVIKKESHAADPDTGWGVSASTTCDKEVRLLPKTRKVLSTFVEDADEAAELVHMERM